MKKSFLALYHLAVVLDSSLYLSATLPCSAQTPAPGNAAQTTPLAGAPVQAASADQRANFEAAAYMGVVIDSFAAQESNALIYPGSAAGPKSSYLAGIDFAYRLMGSPTDVRPFKGSQLWVYGETVHSEVSGDVVCTQAAASTLCPLLAATAPTSVQNPFYSVFRNATALEADAGLRWEFLTLQAKSADAAKLYAKSELGFLSVTGAGAVIESDQKIALGTLVTTGKFKHSFLEAGWGKNDLFRTNPGRRFKVDGYLTWDLNQWMSTYGITPYFEMTVDADFGPGSDSVRTYFGFNFDLSKLWAPPAK